MKIVKKAYKKDIKQVSCSGNDCHCSNARCYAD